MRKRLIPWRHYAICLLAAVCLLVILSVRVCFASSDRPVELLMTGERSSIPIGPYLSVLEDPSGKRTFSDISSPAAAGQFKAHAQQTLHLGMSDSVYWVRLSIRLAPQASPRGWYLFCSEPWIRSIRVYQQPASFMPGDPAYASAELGRARILGKDASMFTAAVPLKLSPSGPNTVYLRLDSRGPLLLVASISSSSYIHAYGRNRMLLLGIYYGAILALFLYNLFLLFFLRERSRLYYVLYVACIGLYFLGINTLTAEYWLRNQPEPVVHLSLFALGGLLLFLSLFSYSFLQIKDSRPFIRRSLKAVIAAAILIIAAVPFVDVLLMNQITVLAGTVFSIYLLIIGITRFWEGFLPARFFVLAFAFLLLGGFIYSLGFKGSIPYSPWILSGLQIGSGLEVVFLAVALADRITVLKSEKQSALKRAEELNVQLHFYGQTLESQVADRTETLLLANEALRKMDQSKSYFLSSVAHELRTPLTVLYGRSRLIMQRLTEIRTVLDKSQSVPIEQHLNSIGDNIDIILSESQRLAEMTDEILDLARIEAGKFDMRIEPISLSGVIADAVKISLPLAEEKGIRLITEISPDLPPVQGDQSRLLQVMINLIANAVKFTDEGHITISAGAYGKLITVRIADTGIGIEPADYKRIFGLFEQGPPSASDPGKGYGLGLVICKNIIERHGGRIWAESNNGQGSVFSFTLMTA